MDDLLTEDELNSLRNSRDIREYAKACDAIKAAHHGDYPIDWWEKVMSSGLAKEVAAKWGQPDAFEIRVTAVESIDLPKSGDSDIDLVDIEDY